MPPPPAANEDSTCELLRMMTPAPVPVVPPSPVIAIAPLPDVDTVAPTSSTPVNVPVVAPPEFALSVTPPFTVEMLESALSRILRVAVRLTLPVPLVAMSDAAFGVLITSAATVSDLFAAKVTVPFRFTVSPASPPLITIDAGYDAASVPISTVLIPVSPALIVSVPVGLLNVSDSPATSESINVCPPPASEAVIVSAVSL